MSTYGLCVELMEEMLQDDVALLARRRKSGFILYLMSAGRLVCVKAPHLPLSHPPTPYLFDFHSLLKDVLPRSDRHRR